MDATSTSRAHEAVATSTTTRSQLRVSSLDPLAHDPTQGVDFNIDVLENPSVVLFENFTDYFVNLLFYNS